jgi:hypothetical protein
LLSVVGLLPGGHSDRLMADLFRAGAIIVIAVIAAFLLLSPSATRRSLPVRNRRPHLRYGPAD